MRTVGVKQLKARLSEYLREVRRGEVFLVTDRDEVIAELRPIGPAGAAVQDDLERALEALAATGQLSLARLPKEGWSWRPAGGGLPRGTSAGLLDETRSDRSETPS
jgi:antitoxin (DNA-binding transcriptional repressor) of toxin-antitoxin stability system